MDIQQLPDEDLAIYVREVDPNAYHEIVSRYEAPLLLYAQGMLSNQLISHEVTQEAFIEIYKNINAFNAKFRFSNFAYRFAHNALKKKLKNRRLDFGEYEEIIEEFKGEDNLEQEFSDNELVLHVKKYLHKLPVKLKEGLVLHFIAQKSYDEISEILQIPVSSVLTRVGLGKKLIKNHAKST